MTPISQRWHNRQPSFRPSRETIKTAEYDVARIHSDKEAKAFVVQHHYSGSYPAARFRFGLYKGETLCGVAVFSHPCNDRVITSVFPGNVLEGVELGRFVLLNSVPGNGETFFLGQCFRYLRGEGLRGVVSFSDPVPRTDRAGNLVFPGHVGIIYQGHNARYLGRGTKRRLRVLPDGTVFSDRAIQKIRSGERGWRYAANILERCGASKCPELGIGDWLEFWLPRLTRRLDHPGNHKYAWGLTRNALSVNGLRYPKDLDSLTGLATTRAGECQEVVTSG